ncbi:MAG TPA: discoidin domain-containing protein [Verrucomicrobiae bacterium]|nr:discoidin domain-containing protein [Verrucomicrobiae bacterium]
MKSGIQRSFCRALATICVLAFCLGQSARVFADDQSKSSDLVPLKLKLPSPVFTGTPKDAPAGMDVEPLPVKPPPPLMVPSDVRNIAPGKKITCSDKTVSAIDLAKITDGNKDAGEDTAAMLKKGLQWIQFDLGAPQEIFAIAIWHAHDSAKVYRSVIVQVADDPDFAVNTHTLFNNDRDNSAGLGVGTDRQYFESYQGKVINAKGVKARYVRLYSHGSSDAAYNEYTEVEIYGRPAK